MEIIPGEKHRPSPAFQFYPKDWLSNGKVKSMTLEERGAYIDLLAIYWNEGGLPSDPMALSRLLGVPLRTLNRLWKNVSKCFEVVGPNLSQSRLEIERAKQSAYRDAQSLKGQKSAKSRIVNKPIQPVLPSGCPPVGVRLEPEPNSSFSSSFASSTPVERESPPALDGKPLDEIECPGCGRLGSLKQSQGRNGNPPGFWCDRRLGCGANWPLNTSVILSQMTSRGRAAIEAMAAAEPRAKTPRKGGAPSWDRPDASQADLDARAAEWIAERPIELAHFRDMGHLRMMAGGAPEDIRGTVTMHLIARNPNLRQVSKGEAA